ncbi:interleukin-10 receptor subunit beta-like [Heterodontus francisci]|uniref:interleukin-10 receptor subunit beta-like n=1 Tax=Heterodontus francisci TaxID=7792 RepID=UPI00355BC7EA
MAVSMFWIILTAVLVFEVFGKIQRPSNIRIHAFNLKYLLKWDDVQRSNYSVNYTVQWKKHCSCDHARLLSTEAQQVNHTMNNVTIGEFRDVEGCESISRTECDFTSPHIFFTGQFFLRLRAQRGSQTSDWLYSKLFVPYKQNEIGPPSVHVTSKEHFLNVDIFDPQMENNASILKTYKDIEYRISFWEKYSNKSRNVTDGIRKVVRLKLKPWTTYCLHVQLFSSTFEREGQFSRIVCEKTKGTTPLWQLCVTFMVSLVIVFGVAMGCSFCVNCTYRCIKYAFFPPHILPEHLQEYFSERSQNAFLELTSEEDAEECCDQLKVISETESLCSYSSSSEPCTRNGKDDQSGQTSADSGQFSNEESSKSDGIEESEERMLTEPDLHT